MLHLRRGGPSVGVRGTSVRLIIDLLWNSADEGVNPRL